MKNRTSLASSLAMALCLLGATAALPARAASVTYAFDQAAGLPQGASMQVTLSEAVSGAIDFTVSLLGGPDPLPEGAGIRDFSFNITPGSDAWWKDATGLEDGWKAKPNKKNDYGLFDVRIKAKQDHEDENGLTDTLQFSMAAPEGGDALSVDDFVSLSIGRAPLGHAYFSATLVGLNGEGGGKKMMLAVSELTAVPLPASIWLLGTAAGMGMVASRRFRQAVRGG